MSFDPRVVGQTYDAVAAEYAAEFASDLSRLPVDRSVLQEAARSAPAGVMIDVGCGPGQVGAYLMGCGRTFVVGVDVSVGMLAIAASALPVVGGDMREMPLRSASVAAVVSFYSIQYAPRGSVGAVLREWRRVLMPGGLIVIATHLGAGELIGPSSWFGHEVEEVGVTLYTVDELSDLVVGAGFALVDVRTRGPLPNEHQGDRVYLTAQGSG